MSPQSMVQFEPFGLEVWQSAHEQRVRFELADSGVQPVTLRELVGMGFDLDALLDLPLRYPEVNGSHAVRQLIAAQHPGAEADGVLVTVGAAEAAGLVVDVLTKPGDTVAIMTPGYAQLAGICRNRGRSVRTFNLDAEKDWQVDPDSLLEAVSNGCQLIVVCDPNNPTGRVLDDRERAFIQEVAERTGAWLLVDEVYAGTELDARQRPSWFRPGSRTVSLGSLSKAYGLSGLRLGWLVADPPVTTEAWRRHEYATIAASAPSMLLAEFALSARVRAELLARNRRLIQTGHRTLQEFCRRTGVLHAAPAQATPVAFVRLPDSAPDSVTTAKRLLDEGDVLVAPGEYFGGYQRHLRITCALSASYLAEALDAVAGVLDR